MTRAQLFEAIRPFAPSSKFTAEHVAAIDALADSFGLPRIEGGNGLDGALKLIKQFEGCKLAAYPDPGSGGDPWTIGFGATGSGIARGVTWTQAQADARLASDVAKFAGGVDALLGSAPTTAGQKAALISFSFNVGLGALKDSTLLKMHRAGDYEGAALQFNRWTKASGRELPGLVKRRAAEAAVYRS